MIVVFAATFIAIAFFYYLDQKRKLRREQQRDRTHKKFEQLLQQLEHRKKLEKK
jgi:hypothetical protein